jgi:hypothetical protein
MVSTLSVDLSARGQEPALTAFLRELAAHPPMIITDGLDLSSNGADVTLRLRGRFLCYDRRLP